MAQEPPPCCLEMPLVFSELLELSLKVVKARVELHVKAREALYLCGDVLFRHERDPGHFIPDGLLCGVIELGLLGAVRRAKGF